MQYHEKTRGLKMKPGIEYCLKKHIIKHIIRIREKTHMDEKPKVNINNETINYLGNN